MYAHGKFEYIMHNAYYKCYDTYYKHITHIFIEHN